MRSNDSGYKGTVISLADLTGNFVKPWVEDGYRAVLVDPQHEQSATCGAVEKIAATILGAAPRLSEIIRSERVVLVAGFPPCTDVAVSGSRWFDKKRSQDPQFQAKAALVAEQCRTWGMAAGAKWFFENPVSVFSSIFGKPSHVFNPYEYSGLEISDNYTKTTCLWCSEDFAMPEPCPDSRVAAAIDTVMGRTGRLVPKRKAVELFPSDQTVLSFYPDNRIHECPPGPERANFRSATPVGFSKAVHAANRGPLPHPQQEVTV